MTNPTNGRKSHGLFPVLAAVACSLASLSGAIATLAAQQPAVMHALV